MCCQPIAHAGRKASTSPPFLPPREGVVGPELGGWPHQVEGPSDVPFAANYPKVCIVIVSHDFTHVSIIFILYGLMMMNSPKQ